MKSYGMYELIIIMKVSSNFMDGLSEFVFRTENYLSSKQTIAAEMNLTIFLVKALSLLYRVYVIFSSNYSSKLGLMAYVNNFPNTCRAPTGYNIVLVPNLFYVHIHTDFRLPGLNFSVKIVFH